MLMSQKIDETRKIIQELKYLKKNPKILKNNMSASKDPLGYLDASF